VLDGIVFFFFFCLFWICVLYQGLFRRVDFLDGATLGRRSRASEGGLVSWDD